MELVRLMGEHTTQHASEMYELLVRGDYRNPIQVMDAIRNAQHHGTAWIGGSSLSTFKDAAGNEHLRVVM